MTRLLVAAALAVPLLGAPAHANYCEGDVPQAVLDQCTSVYRKWCVTLDRVCPPLHVGP